LTRIAVQTNAKWGRPQCVVSSVVPATQPPINRSSSAAKARNSASVFSSGPCGLPSWKSISRSRVARCRRQFANRTGVRQFTKQACASCLLKTKSPAPHHRSRCQCLNRCNDHQD